MTGVLWGLLGAVLIGGSDCIARVTAKHVSLGVLILCIMFMSLSSLNLQLILFGNWPEWHARAWLQSAISGSLNVVVLVLLYKALARGPVAVASPATSVFVVFLIGLNVLTGQSWTIWQIVATLVVFGGVFMLSRQSAADKDFRYDAAWVRVTALYGLAAAFAVAIRMFLAQEAGDELGPDSALYLNRAFALLAVISLIVIQKIKGMKLNWPASGRMWRLVALQSILETLALGAFLMGSQDENRIAATIGFAGFAAATTLTARLWLGEKIGIQRSVWIVVVASGIVLAAIGTPQ